MLFMSLLAVVAYVIPAIVAIWFLMTFKEMRDEIRTIRRYIQDHHERTAGPGAR